MVSWLAAYNWFVSDRFAILQCWTKEAERESNVYLQVGKGEGAPNLSKDEWIYKNMYADYTDAIGEDSEGRFNLGQWSKMVMDG